MHDQIILLPPCAEALAQGLRWKSTPSLEDLRQLGRSLVHLERGSAWWVGDFLNEASRRIEPFDLATIMADLGAASGLGAQAVKTRRRVAAFYPFERRFASLHFSLHAEAIVAGDLETALAWLGRTEREKWSIGELRAAMRRDGETAPRAKPVVDDVGRLAAWAARRCPEVAECGPTEAADLLGHLDVAVRLVDGLRARTGRALPAGSQIAAPASRG